MINHTTCNDCVYNVISTDNPAKEITRHCARFPPLTHAVLTQQGIAMMTAYPVIKNEMLACGEWDDGADIEVEQNHNFPTGVHGL